MFLFGLIVDVLGKVEGVDLVFLEIFGFFVGGVRGIILSLVKDMFVCWFLVL